VVGQEDAVSGEGEIVTTGALSHLCTPTFALGESLERFCRSHAGDLEALDVATRSQREVDLYREYPEYFGYVFFVMTPDPSSR